MTKTDKEVESRFKQRITEGIENSFDSVIQNRGDYFSNNPDQRPTDVSRLINSYTRNNATIAGGASLIPGPWGMAAVAPELILVLKNQVQMIYDIGVAKGKEEQMTKELLIGIFVSALGSGAGGLLVIHGQKVLVRRASLRAIQKVIALLGGKITQQAIKSAVGKWVPLVGAAAIAAWTGYMTRQVGKKADEILSYEIDDDPNTVDIELKE